MCNICAQLRRLIMFRTINKVCVRVRPLHVHIANAFVPLIRWIYESCAYKHSGYAISFSIECGTVVRVWHVQNSFSSCMLGRQIYLYCVYKHTHTLIRTHLFHSILCYSSFCECVCQFVSVFLIIVWFFPSNLCFGLFIVPAQFALCISLCVDKEKSHPRKLWKRDKENDAYERFEKMKIISERTKIKDDFKMRYA